MWKCKCGTEGKENFYKSSKNLCKECFKVRSRKNRADNIDNVREYDRNRKNAKDRVVDNRERVKNYTPEQKAKYNKQRDDWRKKNKHKRVAHNAVAKALMNGKLVRSLSCERCPETSGVVAHHPNYNEVLEVIWLCDSCHKKEHKKLRTDSDFIASSDGSNYAPFDKKVPVVQYDLNGDVVAEFESMAIATKTTGIGNISLACSGKRKTAGGFRWKNKGE